MLVYQKGVVQPCQLYIVSPVVLIGDISPWSHKVQAAAYVTVNPVDASPVSTHQPSTHLLYVCACV